MERQDITRSSVKRRKRPHDSECLKRKLNKMKRLSGSQYVGFSTRKNKVKQDTVRNAREMGPSCSSIFCQKAKARHCGKFDDSTRSKIFKSFWSLPHWSAKQIFVQGLVKSGINNNVSQTTNSKNRQSFKFFLYLNGNALQV